MRYSLLSRFRGTFLGAALGEFYSQKLTNSDQPSAWLKIAISGAESLIAQGKFDAHDWCNRTEKLHQSVISSGAILSSLPVALIYHENLVKQSQNLQQLISIFPNEPKLNQPIELSNNQKLDIRDGILAVGYAIALSLTEKLRPATLIPQIITYLGDSDTALVRQLAQVQTFLETGTSLETIITQLRRDAQPDSTPIALAFYCFLSTPEYFRLSVIRAARTTYQPQMTSAIAGLLSGAYNSYAGVPIAWILASNQTEELLQLSDRLLAIWAGVFAPLKSEKIQLTSAVAAPHVIQPR